MTSMSVRADAGSPPGEDDPPQTAAPFPRVGSVRARSFGAFSVDVPRVRSSGEVLAGHHPVERMRRVDWDRAQVAVVALFHGWLAVALVLAPEAQVATPGVQPALDLFPRQVWAGLFAAAAVAALLLWRRITVLRQVGTWMLVIPLSFAWIGALTISVLIEGRGSAIAAVVWPTLLVMWCITAVRIAIHTD